MKLIDRCQFEHDGRERWCLAFAWGHAAGYTTLEQFDELGRRAAAVAIENRRHSARLFSPSSGFGFGQREHVRHWCALTGKTTRDHQSYPARQTERYGRCEDGTYRLVKSPTLAQFAKANPVGTFIVAYPTHGRASKHALCVKDGVVYGRGIQMRKRLCESFEVLDTPQAV